MRVMSGTGQYLLHDSTCPLSGTLILFLDDVDLKPRLYVFSVLAIHFSSLWRKITMTNLFGAYVAIFIGDHQRAVLKPLREDVLRLSRSRRREPRQQASDLNRALCFIEDEEIRLVEVGDRNS